MNFTKGGFAQYQVYPAETELQAQSNSQMNEGREGFYGWSGFGGSIFQWHPELQISFAYVPYEANFADLSNTRGKTLQVAVVNCIK